MTEGENKLTVKSVVSFIDEKDEIGSFAVGAYSAFRRLQPGNIAVDLPEELTWCVKKQYNQYLAGFYITRCAMAVVALVIGYASMQM